MADSIYESKYISSSESSKKVAWLETFIGDLGVVPTIPEPVEPFYDNKGAVAFTN